MSDETQNSTTIEDLLSTHVAELASVQSQLYEMAERRKELQVIVATLRAAKPTP